MEQGNPVTCAYSKFPCKRESLKSSKDGYCIFHAKAEDKNERKFKKALKKYIEEGNYDFRSFVFVGDINFKEDFGVVIFKWANFGEASFQGKAYFGRASFQGVASFGGASFQGEASFWEASFQGSADFGRASFQGRAYFGGASFQGRADFEGASFQGRAYFGEASFQGSADFGRASFQGSADFGRASFQGRAYFGGAEFRTKGFISPKYMKGDVSLVDAILENVSLTPLNLDESAQIDFTGARARNTDIRREDIEGHIKQEREKDFSKAKEIYLLLKNNFHSLGRYDDESWAFRKEKEMERKSFWHFRKEHKQKELGEKWKSRGIKDCFYPVLLTFEYAGKYAEDHWLLTPWTKMNRWFPYVYMAKLLHDPHSIAGIASELGNFTSFIATKKKKKMRGVSCKEVFRALWFYMKYPMNYFWSTLLKWLYGWGEKPWLIFIWCGITILIFSGLYCFIGDIATATNATIVKSYPEKLYFSGITFTTLGFGGYSPIGGAKALAFIESFLGIFSIALFVYSFARRTAGR